MTKTATALDYGRRIERVAAHIAAHLDAELDLAALAEVACLSPCHFHRVYRSLSGETPAETLRRLRLARAAGELVQGSTPVAAIARRAGYGGTEAFTRAFRAAYGLPPAAYRARRRLVPLAIAKTVKDDSIMYDVDIRETEPLRLAVIGHVGSYMEIGGAFDRLYAWAAARGLIGPTTRAIGVYYDDPAAKPTSELRSDAGIVVGPDVEGDGDVRIVTLQGGRCAAMRHKGPYAELEGVYRWLFGAWLPQSGEEPADQPVREEYLNNPRTTPPTEWLTEIRLPLK